MKKKIWERIKLIVRETFNLATNVLTPLMAIVALGMEIVGVPNSIIRYVKIAEDWLYKFAGTRSKVDNVIEAIDKEVK